jgi:hypothetical protein
MDKMEMKHQLSVATTWSQAQAPRRYEYTVQRQGHNAAARVRPYLKDNKYES